MPILPEPPTKVRYWILALAVAMAILLYLDRYAFSIVAPLLEQQLKCSKHDLGTAFGAFFYAYALAQVPAGWLGDRWGGRLTLALYVGLWSAVMAGTAFAQTLGMIVLFRILLGLFQAGAYATTASFLKRWFPLAQRGMANGSVAMGGRAGNLVALLLTPPLIALFTQPLIHAGLGWRITFIVYAGCGGLWAIIFYRYARNTPDEIAECNPTERALIEGSQLPSDPRAAAARPPFPWRELLRSRNVQLLCAINFCVNVGWIYLVTWLPEHLTESYHLTLAQAGWFTAGTGLAGMLGCVGGGWITDFLVRRLGLVWGRRVPALLACGCPALAYAGCLATDDLWVLLFLLASVFFFADLWNAAAWSTYQDIGGVHVGSVLAIGNMCGNLGAALFATKIGDFANSGAWWKVFAISSASFLAALVCWLFVNPRITIGREEPAA
ncbi:MAG TPA: MFS transporter [Pirellulales bacterium]|nr:MFS transporter [Pirellulales bacterium]